MHKVDVLISLSKLQFVNMKSMGWLKKKKKSFNDFNLRVCKLLTCDPVLQVFFVCFPVQFYTAHAVHYGLLSVFATGKIEPRVGFASSVCIPVGRPYSTCPRISFSHSFLQVFMSLLHRRTHANCQTRTQQTPNP